MTGNEDEKEGESSSCAKKRAAEFPSENGVVKKFRHADHDRIGSQSSHQLTTNKSHSIKAFSKTALHHMLLSKYADVAELILAIDKQRPNCLQEIWHSIRYQQPEEEDGALIFSEQCDFGVECEMPWLHPVVGNYSVIEGCENDDNRKSDVIEEELKNSTPVRQLPENPGLDLRTIDWRFGAAQYWYDLMGVSKTGEGFSYGFKLREEKDCPGRGTNYFADDAYLMVSQVQWEDDVIWNADNIKPEELKAIKSKWSNAGWQPRVDNSRLTHGLSSYRGRNFLTDSRGRVCISGKPLFIRTPLYSQASESYNPEIPENYVDGNWKSIFPFENDELVYGRWENDIIWDAENMAEIPQPKVPTLDPSDENVILGIPDDLDVTVHLPDPNSSLIKLSHPYKKNLKILIKKTGILKITEEDSDTPKVHLDDPFNVSNDDFYSFKPSDSALRLKPIGGKLIQHSIPVLELRQPFLPTHMGPVRLVNFHRPSLKRFSHGVLYRNCRHPVLSLTKEIKRKEKERELERIKSGGGDVYYMRTPEDLSGRDGELVLVEFSEEHPPLINEVGMCSKIVNYYKRKASKDQGPPNHKYGEIVYAHSSPFLGSLGPGQCLQAIENNMYRSPIYPHGVPESDFIIIRTRNEYCIREADALFVAGQQCPLYEVPAPNSRCATNFAKEFLQVYIYRLFMECPFNPRWAKMDDIKKAFPNVSDLVIRKFLKHCADFKRIEGKECHCWVLRSDFRLPSEEELRSMISPEQCCAYFSMLAAEQRLKYAGYGGNIAFAPQNYDDDTDDDDNELQVKLDDEVKAAPWNTSRTFIQALSGKCVLEVGGTADPTGCGEAFSYIRRPIKHAGKKNTDKTDKVEVDDRKLSISNARDILKKRGVPEKEIKKLSCWELMDVVRTMSKRKMRPRRPLPPKGPKEIRTATAENLMRYKEECQRVFDLQNRVLASSEELSTDEEESSDEEQSDVEEMGKILERLLSEGKSYSELNEENEEKEREELVKMMMEENSNKQVCDKAKQQHKDKKEKRKEPQPGRVLKIHRTFRDSTGKEYTRVEFVRKSSVIDIYLKIRTTKDESFIRRFAVPEDALKEKRRLQGQLSRLKRQEEQHHAIEKQDTQDDSVNAECSRLPQNVEPGYRQEVNSQNHFGASSAMKLAAKANDRKNFKAKIDPKRKCKACGEMGHMRSSKLCPLYSGPVNVAMTQEEEEEYERQLNVDDQNLVNVDGTKLKLSVKLIKRAEEMKRRTLVLRVPKEVIRRRKRPVNDAHCDYLEKFQRSVNRRRTDPVIIISNIFETILNEMRDLPDSDPFHFPVDAKRMPSYYQIITQPMDLQTMRDKLRNKKYMSREAFLVDVNQMVENSALFNGLQSAFTINARKMMNLCVDQMAGREEELMRLEESIISVQDEKRPSERSGRQRQRERRAPPGRSGFKVDQDLTISESEEEAEPEAEPTPSPAPVVPCHDAGGVMCPLNHL